MVKKEFYYKVLGLSEYEVDEFIRIAGEMGLTVPALLAKFCHDLVGEEFSDDPERTGFAEKWMEKMYAAYCKESAFLPYLMGLNEGDSKEFLDCLLFLKEKQEELDRIDILLKQIEGHATDEIDANLMAEFRRICGSYGVDVDEENIGVVKACLEEVKRSIRFEMYAEDMGFEPDNLYSAPDVVKQKFDDYCSICGQDADMTKELKTVIDWCVKTEKTMR